jgi:uncharacterized repeat protein (TIGR01451 family)
VIALPGQNLTHTINYDNPSPASLSNMVIFDSIPNYTTLVSAPSVTCPQTLPQSPLPPPIGTNGSIQWSFTGNLISGGSGSVSFVVRIKY